MVSRRVSHFRIVLAVLIRKGRRRKVLYLEWVEVENFDERGEAETGVGRYVQRDVGEGVLVRLPVTTAVRFEGGVAEVGKRRAAQG